jgi:hypothetical protein
VFSNVTQLLQGQLGAVCEDIIRQSNVEAMFDTTGVNSDSGTIEVVADYVQQVFGGDLTKIKGVEYTLFKDGSTQKISPAQNVPSGMKTGWGVCAKRGLANICRAKLEQAGLSGSGDVIETSGSSPKCKVDGDFYRYQCETLAGGMWNSSNSTCYIKP